MKKTRLLYLVATVLTVLSLALQWKDPDLIREKLESKTYDLRLMLRNHFRVQHPLRDIVIVAIDEKSIREVGRWPWGRNIQAELISRLSQDRPKVIGVDIMYTEPENREADGRLAKAIKEAGNVVLAMPFFIAPWKKNAASEEAPDFLWDSAFMEVNSPKGINWKDFAMRAESVNPPLEELSRVAVLGNVLSLPDMDGVTRWEGMYVLYGDDCYPQFSLQVARLALGLPMNDLKLYPSSSVKLGGLSINTNLYGRVLINYLGGANSFHYESATDVMHGRTAPGLFKDKIVLIGTTALATYDQKVTPLSGDYPGVEKNATVVQNILTNNFLTPSHNVIEMAFIVLTGVFLGLLLPRLRALKGSLLAAGLIASYLLLSFWLLLYKGLLINILYPVANMSGIFILQTIIMYVYEEKRAREIRRMFSSYVSPKIVELLINDPETAGLGGTRREVTILFSDIRGFTSISERHSPEEVVAILNEYLGEMTEIVFTCDGTLDKFIGDAVMAFWGAPLHQDNHAAMAVKCALEMTARLDALRLKWKAEGKPDIDIGIGINTGEVLVGNIGAVGKKMDYTAIGDDVNLASRIESLTKKYGARILITESTFGKIRGACSSGALGSISILGKERVVVKGKETPVGIYELAVAKDSSSGPVIIECEDRVVTLTEK